MPQLFSRMDDINWLTPSIADVLDQGPTPPGGDGSIRQQMLWLQQRLSDLETPARVINVRPTPSYTLFIVRPDSIGRRGNRVQVTANDIKRSLGQIAEERREWKLGFLPQLHEIPDALGILLRTDEHKPISLRRLLVRTTFRDHPSTMAFPIGNTLEQRLIVEDLSEVGNLLFAGADSSKRNFINALLLTLVTLNTPGELRLVLAGGNAEPFKQFTLLPHTLGRLLTTPNAANTLLQGLLKEMDRRQEAMSTESVDTLAAYNLVLKDQGKTRIPRILVVIDSLSDDLWKAERETWIPLLNQLLSDHGKSGIHLILTVDQPAPPDLPEQLIALLSNKIISRSVANAYINQLENFHGSLLRFVEAFYVEGNEIAPVEICAIQPLEIQNTVEYWQQINSQRQQESSTQPVSGRTGVTQMLSQEPQTSRLNLQAADDDESELLAVSEENPLGLTPPQPETRSRNEISLQQAQALAAYLGWIGIGPLQDILGMSSEEAMKTITVLKTMGIVEGNNSTTPRFIRVIGKTPDKS